MTLIRKLSVLARKYADLATMPSTGTIYSKQQILQELDKARVLIDEDLKNILKSEQSLKAQRFDAESRQSPDEVRVIDKNLMIYKALRQFIAGSRGGYDSKGEPKEGSLGLEPWLDKTIDVMKSLSAIHDMDDRKFLTALKAHFTTLTAFITKEQRRLAIEGLRLDVAELFSLAHLRRVIGKQTDAVNKTPNSIGNIPPLDEEPARRQVARPPSAMWEPEPVEPAVKPAIKSEENQQND